MFYSHVIDDALESKVGKSGLPQASLDRELARASAALDRFRQWKADGTLPLLSLPGARDDLGQRRAAISQLCQAVDGGIEETAAGFRAAIGLPATSVGRSG